MPEIGKDRSNPSGGGKKGKESQTKSGAKNKKTNLSGGLPIQMALFMIVGSVQWAMTFVSSLYNVLPGRGNVKLRASTVDDIIKEMCTRHVFRVDANLALDTFRELRAMNATDIYGQTFTMKKFRELVNNHPVLSKCRVTFNPRFQTDWEKSLVSLEYRETRRKAREEAWRAALAKADELYQSAFKAFLKNEGVSLNDYNNSADSMKSNFRNRFNKQYGSRPEIIWDGPDKTAKKWSVRNGHPVSQGDFNKAFTYFYDKKQGAEIIPRAYVLKGKVKVQPELVIHRDGTKTHARLTGEHVTTYVDWSVVLTPWKGEDEFYLARRYKWLGKLYDPAEAHLLWSYPKKDKDGTTRKNPKFIEKAKEAWNKSLGRRNGWIPNKDLAPAYGPQMVEVMNDESIMLTVNEAGVWSVTDRKQELQRRNSKRSNKKRKQRKVAPLRGKATVRPPREDSNETIDLG